MRTEVLRWLQNKSEEGYQKFSKKLLPEEVRLLGVRIPTLRKYAKQLIKEGGGEEYLNISLNTLQYQEELMLYSLILANIKLPIEEKIAWIKNFIPYINSWAVCDIFCSELKETRKYMQLFYDTFQPLLRSQKEYQIRFFYVLALSHFLTPEYVNKIFINISKQAFIGFYDKMAAAWLLSVAYVKFPAETEKFLFNTPLDAFVFQKTISKICDSLRVTRETKIRLRTLASAYKR